MNPQNPATKELIAEIEGVISRNFEAPEKFQKAVNLIIGKITDHRIDTFISNSNGGWICTLICNDFVNVYNVLLSDRTVVKRTYSRDNKAGNAGDLALMN